MSEVKTKKSWPFKKPEFGNPEQIKFLQIKVQQQKIIDDYKNGEGVSGSPRFNNYTIASCSECHDDGESRQSEDGAFESLTKEITDTDGTKYRICIHCDAVLKN